MRCFLSVEVYGPSASEICAAADALVYQKISAAAEQQVTEMRQITTYGLSMHELRKNPDRYLYPNSMLRERVKGYGEGARLGHQAEEEPRGTFKACAVCGSHLRCVDCDACVVCALPPAWPGREEHRRLREEAPVLQVLARHFSVCVPLVRVLNQQVLTTYGKVRSRLPVEEIRKVETHREENARFNHQKMMQLAKFVLAERNEREGIGACLQAQGVKTKSNSDALNSGARQVLWVARAAAVLEPLPEQAKKEDHVVKAGRTPEEEAQAVKDRDDKRREKQASKARKAKFKRQGMIRAVRELVLSVVELRAWPQRVDPDLQDLPEGRFVRPVLLPQLVTAPRFEDYDCAEFWMAVVEQIRSSSGPSSSANMSPGFLHS